MAESTGVKLAKYILSDGLHDFYCSYWAYFRRPDAEERCDCWFGEARRLALQVLDEAGKDTQGTEPAGG